MSEGGMEGLIFDIKKFAVHDGPGIRTTLFMKGCPLRCVWCHNPEGISPRPEIVFFGQKCIGCKRCFEACPTGALSFKGGVRVYERASCALCGRCTEACYAEAQVMEGRIITVEDALAEIEKDRPFYENSSGGVTVSGGEPLAQKAFVGELLRRCQERGIHTALDTCGLAPWEDLREVAACADLVLFDLKVMDASKHERFTGVGNALILENLRRLDQEKPPLWIRIPVVPGHTDSRDNMEAIAEFLADLGSIQYVELLPYHRLGESKYARLDRPYPLSAIRPPGEEKLRELEDCLRLHGLPVKPRWADAEVHKA